MKLNKIFCCFLISIYLTLLFLLIVLIENHNKQIITNKDIIVIQNNNIQIENKKQEDPKIEINENNREDIDLYTFVQPTFVHPKLDTTKFNYDGKCREPFKYKRNNKRDLLFHSYHFKDENSWYYMKESLSTTFEINKSGIPNARKVFMTYGNVKCDDMDETLKKYGYEVVESDIQLQKGEYLNVAVYRYFDLEKYLLKHKDEFDRVAITDVKDVYWFADGFQTIGDDELIIMLECDDLDENNNQWCRTIGDGPLSGYNSYWVKECYSDELLEKMEKDRALVVNSGFVAGSTEKMLKFLRIYNGFMAKSIDKFYRWGLDQSALTIANYFGLFNELNITLEKYSQRMGNDMRGRYKYEKDDKVLYMLSKKCSPVIRHKVDSIDA